MSMERKVGLVQAFTGAVVLTLLLMPMGILDFVQYIWLLFLPLIMFFALKAQFKVIPSIILCYICGVVWAFLSRVLQSVFATFAPQIVVETVPTTIFIFLVLTVQENLLAKKIFGNALALFMGMSTTFFVYMMGIDLTPFHLVGFFAYGIMLSVVLVRGGGLVYSLVFGKEAVQQVFADKAAHD